MKTADLSSAPEVPVSHNGAVRKHVLLAAGVVPGVLQFARARFPAGENAAAHSHADMAELFWVESGKGTMTVDGERVALSPGRFVCVERGEMHELAADAGEELVVVYASVHVPAPDKLR